MFVDRIETIASRWGDEKYNEGLWSASDWEAGWLKDVTKAVWYKQASKEQVNALAYLDTDKDFPPDILDGRFPSLHRLHMFVFKFDARRLRETWFGRMGSEFFEKRYQHHLALSAPLDRDEYFLIKSSVFEKINRARTDPLYKQWTVKIGQFLASIDQTPAATDECLTILIRLLETCWDIIDRVQQQATEASLTSKVLVSAFLPDSLQFGKLLHEHCPAVQSKGATRSPRPTQRQSSTRSIDGTVSPHSDVTSEVSNLSQQTPHSLIPLAGFRVVPRSSATASALRRRSAASSLSSSEPEALGIAQSPPLSPSDVYAGTSSRRRDSTSTMGSSASEFQPLARAHTFPQRPGPQRTPERRFSSTAERGPYSPRPQTPHSPRPKTRRNSDRTSVTSPFQTPPNVAQPPHQRLNLQTATRGRHRRADSPSSPSRAGSSNSSASLDLVTDASLTTDQATRPQQSPMPPPPPPRRGAGHESQELSQSPAPPSLNVIAYRILSLYKARNQGEASTARSKLTSLMGSVAALQNRSEFHEWSAKNGAALYITRLGEIAVSSDLPPADELASTVVQAQICNYEGTLSVPPHAANEEDTFW